MKKPSLIFLYAFCLCSILMCSCGKDGMFGKKTKAEGTVLDERTRQPIPDATVTLFQNPNIDDGPDKSELSSQKSDANGKFSFSFSGDFKSYSYYVTAKKDKYGMLMNNVPGIEENGKTDIEILMIPSGLLNLRFINSNGGLSFRLSGYDKRYTLKSGADTVLAFRLGGNISHTVTYWITGKDSFERIYTDYVYVPAFETIVHDIRY